MSKRYQVLARRYRPQRFSDVLGQAPAVTTLKNAIRFNRIANAYLFCGSRGIGKTTLARLFAKALNCQALSPDLEPCNECGSCQEIRSGQSLDVIEIDGASNRGIDDIRQINETIGYAPSQGKYKIYIIDEVHMLTKEAFNALLKTLEEPPETAKFFFATTEPHKVLPTILSRCQRFDLARIENSFITLKLSSIAKDLKKEVESKALDLIACFSEGSLRDAESLFDQILCFSEGAVTTATVRQTLGLAPEELFTQLDEAFANYRLSFAFELTDQLFQMGKDLAHFFEQLIEHYRNIVHAKLTQGAHPSQSIYTESAALHILDLLIQKEPDFQKSPFQRISLESILLQIIRSRHRIPIEVLVRHLKENRTDDLPFMEEPKTLLKKDLPPSPPVLKPVPFHPVLKEAVAPVEESPMTASRVEQNNKSDREEKAVPVKNLIDALTTKSDTGPILAEPHSFARKEGFAEKHPSHYDTVMRFAAVEFEGVIKK